MGVDRHVRMWGRTTGTAVPPFRGARRIPRTHARTPPVAVSSSVRTSDIRRARAPHPAGGQPPTAKQDSPKGRVETRVSEADDVDRSDGPAARFNSQLARSTALPAQRRHLRPVPHKAGAGRGLWQHEQTSRSSEDAETALQHDPNLLVLRRRFARPCACAQQSASMVEPARGSTGIRQGAPGEVQRLLTIGQAGSPTAWAGSSSTRSAVPSPAPRGAELVRASRARRHRTARGDHRAMAHRDRRGRTESGGCRGGAADVLATRYGEGVPASQAVAYLTHLWSDVVRRHVHTSVRMGETGRPTAGPAHPAAVPGLAEPQFFLHPFAALLRERASDGSRSRGPTNHRTRKAATDRARG